MTRQPVLRAGSEHFWGHGQGMLGWSGVHGSSMLPSRQATSHWAVEIGIAASLECC